MKISLLSLFLLQTTQGAQILRHRRDAEPLFGGIVNNILGIFSGGQNNPPAPPPSYHRPAPTYHRPAPSYKKPAPTYHAPAPSYHAPAPTHHAPAPVHHAPAPVYHAPTHHAHAPAPASYDPPAPKPEIHILPAPDLSQYAPTVDSYGSPVATTYVEPAPVVDSYGSPEAAPAVDSYGSPVASAYVEPAPVTVYVEPVPVYEQPAPAPAYEAPTEAPISTYVEPAPIPTYEEPAPIPTYVEPSPVPTYVEPAPAPAYVEPVPVEPVPTYEAAPVYEPTNYEPAPVDISPLARAQPVPETAVIETLVPDISEVVTLKEAEIPEEVVPLVDLRATEERDPKAINFDPAQVNTIQPISIKSEEDVIIDLTRDNDNFIIVTEATLLKTEVNDEAQPVAITFDQSPIESLDQLPILQPVELPATPPEFETPSPTTQTSIVETTNPPVTVETTVVDVVDSVQTQEPVQIISFHTVDQENVVDTFHTVDEVTTEVPIDLPVTPIVASEELRSLVQPQEEIFFVTNEGNDEVEVFDLVSGDQQTGDLTIVELSDPEITRTIEQEAELVEEELVEEFGEEAVINLEKELVNEVEEELVKEVEEEIINELENEVVEKLEEELVQEAEEEIINELENELVEKLEEDAVSLLEEEAIKELEEVVEELESVVEEQSEASNPAPQPQTTKAPTLRKVTFKILGPDETTPEPSSFRLVDPEDAAVDTFTVNDEELIPDAPESLNSDPAFVEIAAEASPLEQKKRGLRNYDPRKRVYGHKYNDQFSNWYYYSRNGY